MKKNFFGIKKVHKRCSYRKPGRHLGLKSTGMVLVILFFIVGGWYLGRPVTASKVTMKTIATPASSEVPITSTPGKAENAINTAAVQKTGTKNLNLLKKELQQYIKNFDGRYGIYYYNLVSNESMGVNQEEEYTAASTIKIPLNLYLYKKIKSGSINPLDKMTYEQEDYEEGTGVIQDEPFGKKYSIKELSRLSIVCSDNVASNMLFRLLGKSSIKEYMRQLGGSVVDDDKNTTSPRDMGLYMKGVYDFCNREKVLGKDLMNNLLNTEFNDRIPALLPKTVKVAHKIGTQLGVVNDVGIVYSGKPYILSVLSKNVNDEEAPEVIATISKKIYDFTSR